MPDMKKIAVVLVAVAVVAAVAALILTRGREQADEIPLKMGSFESMPPSEKDFKVDDMDIKFGNKAKRASAAERADSVKKGE